HWLKLLLMRKFISEERHGVLLEKLNTLGVKLNNFIDTIKRKL
ncbi:MAG: four helix bundle protein, partial [Flexistipes sinusarabici]